mgnify:CR=1 FL=1
MTCSTTYQATRPIAFGSAASGAKHVRQVGAWMAVRWLPACSHRSAAGLAVVEAPTVFFLGGGTAAMAG